LSGIIKPVWPLIGFVMGLVVILVIAGLGLANAISVELTEAATTGAGFLTLVMLFAAIKMFSSGK
jgi:hypothetical protein